MRWAALALLLGAGLWWWWPRTTPSAPPAPPIAQPPTATSAAAEAATVAAAPVVEHDPSVFELTPPAPMAFAELDRFVQHAPVWASEEDRETPLPTLMEAAGNGDALAALMVGMRLQVCAHPEAPLGARGAALEERWRSTLTVGGEYLGDPQAIERHVASLRRLQRDCEHFELGRSDTLTWTERSAAMGSTFAAYLLVDRALGIAGPAASGERQTAVRQALDQLLHNASRACTRNALADLWGGATRVGDAPLAAAAYSLLQVVPEHRYMFSMANPQPVPALFGAEAVRQLELQQQLQSACGLD